jgi:hypothetical protein
MTDHVYQKPAFCGEGRYRNSIRRHFEADQLMQMFKGKEYLVSITSCRLTGIR